MPDRVRAVLRGSKDAALGVALRTFVNARLGEIGTVSNLSIDTGDQALHLSLALSGEVECIDIHVIHFALSRDGDQATITIEDATTSRAWVSAALRTFVVGRPFPIPTAAMSAVELLA